MPLDKPQSYAFADSLIGINNSCMSTLNSKINVSRFLECIDEYIAYTNQLPSQVWELFGIANTNIKQNLQKLQDLFIKEKIFTPEEIKNISKDYNNQLSLLSEHYQNLSKQSGKSLFSDEIIECRENKQSQINQQKSDKSTNNVEKFSIQSTDASPANSSIYSDL
jgi:hypothetical protein